MKDAGKHSKEQSDALRNNKSISAADMPFPPMGIVNKKKPQEVFHHE